MNDLLQVSRQPGHNQQLSRSHVVDLNHVSYHWIRGYGPEHVLWERSLPSDWHHGEEAEGAHVNLGAGF